MVYVFGTAGFVLGFGMGLYIISLFLKAYSQGDLVSEKSLRWTYGTAVWLFAGLGAWVGVWFYKSSIF